MHETGMVATASEDFGDPIVLAEGGLPHELDLRARVARPVLRVHTDLFAERLGKARVVEQAHMVLAEERSHPTGVAEARKRALDHDSVEAGQHPRQLAGVTVDQRGHRNLPVTRPSSLHPERGGYGSCASSASMSL